VANSTKAAKEGRKETKAQQESSILRYAFC
jgi:hypothetical protein